MHLINLILIFVGGYHSLSRHFVVAVAGICVGCSSSHGNTHIPASLSQDPYNPVGVLSGPRAYAGPHDTYTIYCGAQNTQVQTSLNAAISISTTILNEYWSPFQFPVRASPFEPFQQIFPTSASFRTILSPITSFLRGLSVRVPGQGGLTSRSVVCAASTMFWEYGLEVSYYDVCKGDPTIVAYHPLHSASLVLCPSFFELPVRVHGRQCPTWNKFLQTFYTSYEPLTVEYQTYTLIRGFLDVTFDIEENIVVSPNPRVPNWNELISLPLNQKMTSSALYQLYIALIEQQCRLSPPPAQDDLNDYIRSLVEFYLEKQNAEAEAAVREVVEEMIDNVAGPSTHEVGESSSGAAD